MKTKMLGIILILCGLCAAEEITKVTSQPPVRLVLNNGVLSASIDIVSDDPERIGVLTPDDWNTFNDKQDKIDWHGPFDVDGNSVTLPKAAADANGYLDMADWSNFNDTYLWWQSDPLDPYLLADGTTELTANWAVGGFDITGIGDLAADSGTFSHIVSTTAALGADVLEDAGFDVDNDGWGDNPPESPWTLGADGGHFSIATSKLARSDEGGSTDTCTQDIGCVSGQVYHLQCTVTDTGGTNPNYTLNFKLGGDTVATWEHTDGTTTFDEYVTAGSGTTTFQLYGVGTFTTFEIASITLTPVIVVDGEITDSAFGPVNFGTLAIGSGSITDTSGAISFGDENLNINGEVTVGGNGAGKRFYLYGAAAGNYLYFDMDGDGLKHQGDRIYSGGYIGSANGFRGPSIGPTGDTDLVELTANNVAVNGALAATGNVTGANLNISDWDTAYGWGDHSGEGYLTEISGNLAGDLDGQSTYDLNNMVDGTFSGTIIGNQLQSTPDANASGARSIAWGQGAIASADDSYAIGGRGGTPKSGYIYCTASDIGCIALGTGAWATSDWAIAAGLEAKASVSYGVAIGRQSLVDGGNSGVAIGYLARAAGVSAVGIGTNVAATGSGSTAVGASLANAVDNSVAIGITNAAFTATSAGAVLPLDTQLGDASTDTITATGRFIPRDVGQDPTAIATAGSIGEIVTDRAAGKAYLKTTGTGTDTNWSALN